jgi:heme oxygenase
MEIFMSLKELTKEKHTEAENTPFMKAVFNKTLAPQVWTYWTFNKMHWYNVIELRARDMGLLDDIPGIERTYKLYQDFRDMAGKYHKDYNIGVETEKYCEYIFDLKTPDEVLAHLYVWHMGDLYGGQAIKKLMADAPSRSLEFNNREFLIDRIRTRLKDDLAPEAIVAFDWAIRLMNQFVIDGGEDV